MPSSSPRLRSALAAGLLTLACTAATLALVPAPAQAAELPGGFRSVGYLPSWSGDVNAVPYGKLTHVNYAFVLPNGDGTLRPVENPAKLSQLVSRGHAGNVKVSIAIGGWNNGDDSAFEALADGTRLQIWDRFGGANQVWRLPA
ncbi:hypothetical protein KBX06_19635 [Micromonospora sp. C31]|uniref:glycosyl hydrolase family 18 protein n=1 Tax=Micromonospora sp. C31 TaxID=2824876 RepID=UPI001B37BD67|nr:glycosyl hydrolase family 18 protein [Micromonospora sp. C31]MBQ1075360.1 hypothetical protein [Micromonospora sp. C31]